MNQILARIESLRIVPVVAIPSIEDAIPLADALKEGGLPCAEITLRTEAGIDAIRRIASRSDFFVGAGTVHSVDQAKKAADAGAKFIVTPGFNPKTVAWCLENQLTVIPGTSSPTDLEMALDFGLKVVKFFPAEACGGVTMLKALSGPYHTVHFMPTGGISPANLMNYLELPFVVACGGSWMVKSDIVKQGAFDEVTNRTAAAMKLLAATTSNEK